MVKLREPITATNDNWVTCDQCGAKRLIEPATGQPEPCAQCDSKSRNAPLVGGLVLMAIVVIAVIAIASVGINMLLF